MARNSKTAGAAGTTIDHNAQYIKQLEDQLAMYQVNEDNGDDENFKVEQTDYVKVMSLLSWRLNLCTREKGQGKIYKFDHFGQVKKIIYADLVDILEADAGFMEEGAFIILNPKVIRIHGLDETYSKILTKEKIEKIIDGSDENLALFVSTNKRQQEIIVDLIIEKLIKDPSCLDMNMIDKLSRLSGISISEKANSSRQLLATATEESKQ